MSKRPQLNSLLRVLALAGAAAFAVQAQAAEEVSLYTTREPKLIQPLLDAFTKESGIKVNTVFVKDGLLERVKAEGAKSPADVLMTVDIGNLLDLVDGGVTQPVKSKRWNPSSPPTCAAPTASGTPCRCATACCTSKRPEAGILPL